MKLSQNKTGSFLILVGIILALPSILGRIKTERDNRVVEILVSPRFGSFENTLIAEEYTFAELADSALASRWTPALGQPFEGRTGRSVVMIFRDRNVFTEAFSMAKIKFNDNDTIKSKEKNGKYYILFKDRSWPDISSVGSGVVLPSAEDKRVYIRPVNDNYVNNRSIERIFAGSSYKGVVFKGDEVLGYPDYLENVNRHLKDGGLMVFNIEFARQRGIKKVAGGVPVAILHSIPPDLKENEVIRRARRAIRERSVRGLYFRDLSHAQALSSNLKKYMLDIYRGTPQGVVIQEKSVVLPFLAAVFVCSGTALLAGLNFGVVFPAGLFLIALIFAHFRSLRYMLVILTATATGPVAVKLAVEKSKNLLNALIFITAFSFLGGIIIASTGWAAEFYTKITPFRGVKLSFILPVLLGGVIFLGGKLKGNLQKPVKWWHLIAVGTTMAVLGLIVFRSSNVSPEFILQGELIFRNLLEDVFVWRPRFKEFLFAHPLLITGLYLYYSQKKFNIISKIMIVLGIIGPLSVANSFMHVHTPIAGSIIRSFYGWVLGLFFAAILIVITKKCFLRQR